MPSSNVQVVLLLPRHSSVKLIANNERFWLLLLCPVHPRIVWCGLQPLLFQSRKRIARRAIRLLLQLISSSQSETRNIASFATPLAPQSSSFLTSGSSTDEEVNFVCMKRVLKISSRKRKRNHRTQKTAERIVLWIQPPLVSIQRADRLFESIVLCWERLYLQLQSLSAFLATLGGGYFLCRQLATAAVLARRQRHLALLLGDYETADKCTINEAYNYVHAGYFAHALRLIRFVRKTVLARNKEIGGRKVILSMCASAKLFCRRVKAFREQLAPMNVVSLTSDDYQRIRIDPAQALPPPIIV